MKHLTRFSLFLLLLLAFSVGGCSHFSKSSRQQRAYARYVRKSSIARVHQKAKLSPGKMQLPPMPQQSDPAVSTESGPASVSASSE